MVAEIPSRRSPFLSLLPSRGPARLALVVCILGVLSAGCTTWRTIPVGPEELHDAPTVRVTRTDSTEVWLADASMTSDHIEGFRLKPCAGSADMDSCRVRGDRTRIDRAQVGLLEIETATGTVVTAVAAVTAVVAGTVFFIWFTGCDVPTGC